MATVCLSMIVRNEEAVIARALQSVIPIVDYWVICDTGSTDQTIPIILHTMAGIAGELHSHEWVNFGHNRTLAIELAREKADYTLLLDADMIARQQGEFKSRLTCDAYEIHYEGDTDYCQRLLVSNRHHWRFIGVTHEFITTPTAKTWDFLPELSILHVGDGGMRTEKFQRDVRLLTEDFARDPANTRSMFYLAESYRHLGNQAEALAWYRKRFEDGSGWDEEVWYSAYQAARMRQALGHDWSAVKEDYLRAYALRPTRLDPISEIVAYYTAHDQFELGYLYSGLARENIPYPADRLFIDKPVYQYRLLLNRAVCAMASERPAEAIEAANRIFDAGEIPDWVAESAIQVRRICLDSLFPPKPHPIQQSNRIKVLVAFHNAGNYLDNCLESLLAQGYSNFQVLLLDDASTDRAVDRIPDDPRFRYLPSVQRCGAAWHHHRAITRFCEPEDIVVYLDGDDWLICDDALSYVNDFYNRHECWVMYGQFQNVNGSPGCARPIATADAFAQLRRNWWVSHLRSHRAGVFQAIAAQDADYNCLKDDSGEWLTSAVDVAEMYAVMELAGFDRVRYNDRVLYVYNSDNPLCWHHVGRDQQRCNFRGVQAQRPFRRIESYVQSETPQLVMLAGEGE